MTNEESFDLGLNAGTWRGAALAVAICTIFLGRFAEYWQLGIAAALAIYCWHRSNQDYERFKSKNSN